MSAALKKRDSFRASEYVLKFGSEVSSNENSPQISPREHLLRRRSVGDSSPRSPRSPRGSGVRSQILLHDHENRETIVVNGEMMKKLMTTVEKLQIRASALEYKNNALEERINELENRSTGVLARSAENSPRC